MGRCCMHCGWICLAVMVVGGLTWAAGTGWWNWKSEPGGTTTPGEIIPPESQPENQHFSYAPKVVNTSAEANHKEPEKNPGPPASAASDTGMPALTKAAQNKKYLFAFFWKDKDEQTEARRKVFEAAVAKVRNRADSITVNVTNPAEKKIVEKFQVDRAPMPLVVVLAPNGAITRGFAKKFEEKDLLNAFGTPCTEKCFKALQDGRLVFLCVQNQTTKDNEAALKGVRDFQADQRFSKFTDIVMLNPADTSEARFLGDLKIDPKTSDALTIFLVPPGGILGEFKGPTQKDDLVSVLVKATSGPCAGGACGPGGCGPRN